MAIQCEKCGSKFIDNDAWVADDDGDEVIVMYTCQECLNSWKTRYFKE